MPGYSFRVRFKLSPGCSLNIDAPRWQWQLGGNAPVLVLCARERGKGIKDSKTLIFKSEGWPSEEDAVQAGERYILSFLLTLARLRMGADIGNRAPKSFFTSDGLQMLAKQSGQRILNDVHGLMVYESEPTPHFAEFEADVSIGTNQRHFEQVFSQAVQGPPDLTDRQRLALELFNAALFQATVDSRFLVLMMAIEALIDPRLRCPGARKHVDSMIAMTTNSTSISEDDKQSLLGSLTSLKYESINQAGKRLVAERLGERVYMGENKPPAFFSYCYGIRSQLVHGEHPQPSQQEIGTIVAQLEVFVSDLLSGSLMDIELK